VITRVALVTGASSGIGAATVRGLLGAGYRVYAGARRVDRMRDLESAGALVLSLDVTDEASLAAAVGAIRARDGRLDVLVNNAGYGSYGALEDVPLDEARRQFEVNIFGLARLTQLITPLMRNQKSGTIFNISSIGGKMYEPLGAWYHASKFALEGLSDCLRVELAPFGIRVVIVEPGAIATEWSGIARASLTRYSGTTAYAAQAASHAALMARADGGAGSDPKVVADAIVGALRAKRPRTRYAVGGGAFAILFLRRILSDRAFDAMLATAERLAAPRREKKRRQAEIAPSAER
jgi:NAD(P)-dependent dehydrogenase (short-subunit alcohol dehydrogenase family)